MHSWTRLCLWSRSCSSWKRCWPRIRTRPLTPWRVGYLWSRFWARSPFLASSGSTAKFCQHASMSIAIWKRRDTWWNSQVAPQKARPLSGQLRRPYWQKAGVFVWYLWPQCWLDVPLLFLSRPRIPWDSSLRVPCCCATRQELGFYPMHMGWATSRAVWSHFWWLF